MSGERRGRGERRAEPPGPREAQACRGEALPLVVRLYSADACSLCHVAAADLAPLAVELGLHVSVVNIAGDPDLEARYRSRIPVAEILGRTVFKYAVDEARLRETVAWARGLASGSEGPPATAA